jgi:hypothetical protein
MDYCNSSIIRPFSRLRPAKQPHMTKWKIGFDPLPDAEYGLKNFHFAAPATLL